MIDNFFHKVRRMARVSLPIFAGSPESGLSVAGDAAPAAVRPVDRSKPYASCEWLEGGIAFNRRGLHACLIVHHGRGFPKLCDFNGGEVPMGEALAARNRIVEENQGAGHEACRGCAHLTVKKWPEPKYAVQVVGIAQFARCNIYCNYCYLQTQDPASFEDGFDPYNAQPAIEGMIRDGHLAPDALLDWGGGEPTIFPEFDPILEKTVRRGARHWIHTNGTRFPKPIRDGLPTKRVHVLCSVDAGFPETYLKMKQRDFLPLVWKNLAAYVQAGCEVVVKYIVKEENSSEPELLAFLDKAKEIGVRKVLIDIDYDYPDPSAAVLHGVRFLKRQALRRGLYAPFGFTGAKFAPELEVELKVDARPHDRLAERVVARLLRMRVTAGLYKDALSRRLRRS